MFFHYLFFLLPFFTYVLIFSLAKYNIDSVVRKVYFFSPVHATVQVQGAPSLSLCNGCRCVPNPGVTVEEFLLIIGGKVGFENIVSASQMNKAVVVFFKSEPLINELTVSGIWEN